MTKIGQWWASHEGWTGVILVGAAMYGLGWITCNTTLRVDYRDDVVRQEAAYREAMNAKDKLIETLSKTTAQAATQAATATAQAVTATTTAKDAADTAQQAATTAAQAVDNKKTLGKLK